MKGDGALAAGGLKTSEAIVWEGWRERWRIKGTAPLIKHCNPKFWNKQSDTLKNLINKHLGLDAPHKIVKPNELLALHPPSGSPSILFWANPFPYSPFIFFIQINLFLFYHFISFFFITYYINFFIQNFLKCFFLFY